MTDYEFVGNTGDTFRGHPDLSAWESYRNHREIVTESIKACGTNGTGSLCVFGAGICHDLELNQLADLYSQITLVDINEADILKGLAYQQCENDDSIEVLGNLDLFGIGEDLRQFQHNPTDAKFDQLIQTAGQYQPPRLGQYDVVASTCVLSQLLFQATQCVPQRHPRFVELLQTIRRRHILIMLESLLSGGTGLLITDFVSSESLPALFDTKDLKATLQKAIANQNFLHGLNPATVGNEFRHDDIQCQLTSMKVASPWRWVMPQRIYACFAVVFEKQ